MTKVDFEQEKQRTYFRPKKRLGQHFLVDQNVQRKIVRACEITPRDTVLEIGAGRGELTRLIARESNRVFALEKDPHLCRILKNNLIDSPQIKIINQDILKFDLPGYFKGTERIKIIGNLPYNITTPIIVRLLKFRNKIKDIIITVQREFARRMAASKGTPDWSALSCFVQYYTQPSVLFIIKKTCFLPKPKVDSALVKLSLNRELPLDNKKERQLFEIIRSSFQQRRKTLKNALSGVVSAKGLTRYFNQYNIDKNIRGEELSLQDFIDLTNAN